MRLAARLLVALLVGTATYFVLVLAALFAAGGVSCTNNCTGLRTFLNDAYPWPMIIGLSAALAAAAWTLRRLPGANGS